MVKKVILILFIMRLASVMTAGTPAQPEKVIISTDRDVYVAGDQLYFMVHLAENGDNTDSYIYLTLNSASGSRIFNGCIKPENNHSCGSIYLADTLTSGIYQLVSFTNQMRDQGSSLYAYKNIIIVNRFDKQFSNITGNINPETGLIPGKPDAGIPPDSGPQITTDKELYGKREKIKVSCRMTNNSGIKILSVSVRQAAPVSFICPEPSGHSVLSGDPCFRLPEKSGLILQGTLTDEKGKPAPDMNVFLSCVDTVPNLQHTITNPEGIFRFFLNPYYFGKMLSIKSDQIFRGSIQVDNKYESCKSTLQPVMSISGNLPGFLENSQKFLTISKSYGQEYPEEKVNPHIEKGYRPSVYESEPQVVFPSDFIPLPDFMEISRELLPLLKTRFHNNTYKASLLGLDLNSFMETFIFVDGVLIEDVNQIISFDSGKIRKIELMPYHRFLGDLHIPGVLSINTVNHETGNLKWEQPVVKIPADSIMHLSTFSPPDSLSIPFNIPDFRQLLFWEPMPDWTGNGNREFETRTSDCTGTFEIVVTCCNENGNRTEWRKEFTVINQ